MSDAKKKERIFVGPQLKNYLKNKTLVQNKIIQKEEPGRHLKMSAETF